MQSNLGNSSSYIVRNAADVNTKCFYWKDRSCHSKKSFYMYLKHLFSDIYELFYVKWKVILGNVYLDLN